MKMTLILTSGLREIVEVDVEPGVTDEDVLDVIVQRWMHAITCEKEMHMMRFRSYPRGEMLVIMPLSVAGMSLKVETMQ